jgi:hypothetical protein
MHLISFGLSILNTGECANSAAVSHVTQVTASGRDPTGPVLRNTGLLGRAEINLLHR